MHHHVDFSCYVHSSLKMSFLRSVPTAKAAAAAAALTHALLEVLQVGGELVPVRFVLLQELLPQAAHLGQVVVDGVIVVPLVLEAADPGEEAADPAALFLLCFG